MRESRSRRTCRIGRDLFLCRGEFMVVPSSSVSRRQFLGGSACNAVGLAAGLVGLTAGVSAASAPDRIGVGVIGTRRQGRRLALEFARQADTRLAALCDVDQAVLDRAARDVRDAGGEPRTTRDFRTVLDDPRIDAVVVATPDHSHAAIAIEALQAGKDVYVETPVTHTLDEAAALQRAAEATDRYLYTGHFERSLPHVQNAIAFVRSGRLGHVPLARAWAVQKRPVPTNGDSSVEAPAGVDYDGWLYPLPERPFAPQRFHRGWTNFWDHGSGELGTNGVALLDLACRGLQLDMPSQISAYGGQLPDSAVETPDNLVAAFRFPQVTLQWEHRQWSNHPPEGRSTGVAFYGERGTLVVDRGGWKVYDAREPAGDDGRADLTPHVRRFIDLVRTRTAPEALPDGGFLADSLCHLGNLAFRSGAEIRLDTRDGTIRDEKTRLLAAGRYRPGVRMALS